MTHRVRRAQLVYPFGVGSLIDSGIESFTCADITHWGSETCDRISDSQLERKLHRWIMTPRVASGAPGVPVVRFPRWLFCPTCRTMHHYVPAQDEANSFKTPHCTKCHQELAPMGFVAVCSSGHMQDVDWFRWAHQSSQIARQGQCSRQTAKLSFRYSGKAGGDWDALEVRCECGAHHDFRGLVGPEIAAGLLSCMGKQPWQKGAGRCSSALRIYRRGAGNIYHPKTISALDLLPSGDAPQEDEIIAIVEQSSWFRMAQAYAQALKATGGLRWPEHREQLEGNAQAIVQEHGWELETVIEGILKACNGNGRESRPEVVAMDSIQETILTDEWPTLARHASGHSKRIHIQPVPIPDSWPNGLAAAFAGISLVHRLREVRALVGFRRVSPDAESALVPVDLGAGRDWCPGVEVWGEGIFLWLREDAVADWEVKASTRLSNRMAALRSLCLRRSWNPATFATPRFVMLHTLAHILMRRLAFEAGYSSASLRERIYSAVGASPMSGLLIYTADSDSEGSLGGLVRMGEPKRFRRTLMNALREASWCSADPVCRESESQGISGANAAACHACALVSETSCAHGNAFLDRRAVLRGNGFSHGFFDLASLEV